ncbi:integrase arm-type DNA-binding domain-containing protein [Neisseria sp. ZJ106]|uniref:Integrase arm-type DNA-binding domain-containing protein n=1 Tax=Neisseria lisongii TaxID=2912188 RepID=A0ABY7RMX5_9NEIS|nr:integrase arm-type DNA-binding domain-containing protein [Neisseria lisongii]MCF7520457.1 integrase arm-type DNA-binding domain-containing protein [Neisseria lisongii]WCL71600.1 integrase arm-type DNA-binding domain-containing protein [Neisseria lisongii]
MPLNDRQIKNAKPADKPYKLADGGGLYLAVTPSGGKLWRLKYRINGKEKLLSIGKYPAVSLVEAREAADNARKSIAAGIDPAAAKQQAKKEKQAALLNTFEHLARQWHKDNLHRWKPNHAARIMAELEKDVFPQLGDKPIDEIRVADVKNLLADIVGRGATVTAEKIRQWIGAVYQHAAKLELTDRNPAAPLRGHFEKKAVSHMPALPREELTTFYAALLTADIDHKNRIAMLLTMLVFPRNTELRGGQWHEIDFEARTWTIPAERMKMKRPHIIPLADWPLELLQELHGLSRNTPYLFPSRTQTTGFISDATLSRIIERMGYKGRVTPHGFRSLASSILNEQGYNPDAIERQLAHEESNRIRAAYNRADYMAERKEMMAWYSDYLRERYHQALAMLEADGETKDV